MSIKCGQWRQAFYFNWKEVSMLIAEGFANCSKTIVMKGKAFSNSLIPIICQDFHDHIKAQVSIVFNQQVPFIWEKIFIEHLAYVESCWWLLWYILHCRFFCSSSQDRCHRARSTPGPRASYYNYYKDVKMNLGL